MALLGSFADEIVEWATVTEEAGQKIAKALADAEGAVDAAELPDSAIAHADAASAAADDAALTAFRSYVAEAHEALRSYQAMGDSPCEALRDRLSEAGGALSELRGSFPGIEESVARLQTFAAASAASTPSPAEIEAAADVLPKLWAAYTVDGERQTHRAFIDGARA